MLICINSLVQSIANTTKEIDICHNYVFMYLSGYHMQPYICKQYIAKNIDDLNSELEPNYIYIYIKLHI